MKRSTEIRKLARGIFDGDIRVDKCLKDYKVKTDFLNKCRIIRSGKKMNNTLTKSAHGTSKSTIKSVT